ncbi:MAG: hypothetical protein JWN84_643 [Nocardioides sp.]|nr:hypothetical protein [Nocardioides sp.]
MRHQLPAALLIGALPLAGCADADEDTAPSENRTTSTPAAPETPPASGSTAPSPTQTPAPPQAPDDGATDIAIEVKDGVVTPAGDRIDVELGAPVRFLVTSDVAGELHVHSSPETYESFEAGTNEALELQFDRPGVIEVELHEPFEGPVVSLEVK